jgi:hypothetical protein
VSRANGRAGVPGPHAIWKSSHVVDLHDLNFGVQLPVTGIDPGDKTLQVFTDSNRHQESPGHQI